MELRGKFKHYTDILDLLQIITMGNKSGEILLNSNGESITLFFKDGKAIDFTSNVPSLQHLRERAATGEIPLEEAMNFLLHQVSLWNEGRFLFVEKPLSYEGIGSADTLNVMMNFTKEEDELPEDVRKAIKENKIFILSEEAELPITVTEEGWRLLVSVCKEIPIWDALLRVGKSFGKDTNALHLLLKHRLIKVKDKLEEEKEEEKEEVLISLVPDEKMEKVEQLLVETMGPMGKFLVEETLEEMNLKQLPADLVPNFVDALLSKIPDTCFIDGEKCRDKLKKELTWILGRYR